VTADTAFVLGMGVSAIVFSMIAVGYLIWKVDKEDEDNETGREENG
jgi:hypothetical protein